uniref:R3H domain containing like n=1 Tax=Anser brachyrhynchus TaxID=132585 RepID=A0A8B9IAU1_9AVES
MEHPDVPTLPLALTREGLSGTFWSRKLPHLWRGMHLGCLHPTWEQVVLCAAPELVPKGSRMGEQSWGGGGSSREVPGCRWGSSRLSTQQVRCARGILCCFVLGLNPCLPKSLSWAWLRLVPRAVCPSSRSSFPDQCAGQVLGAAGGFRSPSANTRNRFHLLPAPSSPHPHLPFLFPPLQVWDERLARAAEAWAVQCVWDHGPPQLMKYVGQNLSIHSGRYRSVVDMVRSWHREQQHYSFPHPRECNPRCPSKCSGSVCSHYTQMVWASSNRLGCAIHACSNVRVWGSTWRRAVLLVCNYAIKGNWIGEAPYKVGRPCSACPPTYGGVCSNNMCFTGLKSNQVSWF